MIPHVSRLLELWRIAAHYRLDTLFPAEELPEKSRHILSLIRMHPVYLLLRELNDMTSFANAWNVDARFIQGDYFQKKLDHLIDVQER